MNTVPVATANRAIRTPRAAAVAGIVFSVLFATSVVLLEWALPSDSLDTGPWVEDDARRNAVSLSLQLLPFAGIAFLWFIGVLRDRIGAGEDRFFATVFLGSGLLFVAMFFASGAVAGGLISTAAEASTGRPRQRMAVRPSQRGQPGRRLRAADGGRVHPLGDHAGHPTRSSPAGWRCSATPPPPCSCSASVSCRGSS